LRPWHNRVRSPPADRGCGILQHEWGGPLRSRRQRLSRCVRQRLPRWRALSSIYWLLEAGFRVFFSVVLVQWMDANMIDIIVFMFLFHSRIIVSLLDIARGDNVRRFSRYLVGKAPPLGSLVA
jgi:hypothetical protein